MAEKDTHCSDVKYCKDVEHVFGWDGKKWVCRCGETILEAQMNHIVERDVRTDTGHLMMIWPAQVKKERDDL